MYVWTNGLGTINTYTIYIYYITNILMAIHLYLKTQRNLNQRSPEHKFASTEIDRCV